MVYKRARNKEIIKGLIINNFILVIPMLMYVFYITFQIYIFRELHIITMWVNIIIICIILIKKPEMLLELTNKIYYNHN